MAQVYQKPRAWSKLKMICLQISVEPTPYYHSIESLMPFLRESIYTYIDPCLQELYQFGNSLCS